jgi:hypothetical protein
MLLQLEDRGIPTYLPTVAYTEIDVSESHTIQPTRNSLFLDDGMVRLTPPRAHRLNLNTER